MALGSSSLGTKEPEAITGLMVGRGEGTVTIGFESRLTLAGHIGLLLTGSPLLLNPGRVLMFKVPSLGRGSVVRSICCSCRGPEFDSQHLRDGSQPSVTPVPEDLTLPPELDRHVVYTEAKHLYT